MGIPILVSLYWIRGLSLAGPILATWTLRAPERYRTITPWRYLKTNGSLKETPAFFVSISSFNWKLMIPLRPPLHYRICLTFMLYIINAFPLNACCPGELYIIDALLMHVVQGKCPGPVDDSWLIDDRWGGPSCGIISRYMYHAGSIICL